MPAEKPPAAAWTDASGLAESTGDWRDWELSPRASLVFLPGRVHSFRLGFGHAYLKPSFLQSSIRVEVEDVNHLGIDELNLGNPDLENQTIDSLELGYSASLLGDRLVIGVDFTCNWHRNTIWFVQDFSSMRYIEIGSLRIPDLGSPEGITFRNFPKGLDGHNLDVQVTGKPSQNIRVFLQAGYRQVFFNHSLGFDRHEPVLRLGAGADLATSWGLSLSLRAFYTGARTVEILDPDSILEPSRPYPIPANLLVNARIAWTVFEDPLELSVGLEGFNLLDRRYRENSGIAYPNQPDYNAERLDRRIVLFARGRI